jgi:hypothetical protein
MFGMLIRRRFEDHQLALAAVQLGRKWADRWTVRRGPGKSQWARVRESAALAMPDANGSERDSLLRSLREVFKREKWTQSHKALQDKGLGQEIECCLRDDAGLRKELTDLDLSEPRAVTLQNRLAIAACREAAIEVVRRQTAKEHSSQ